MLSSSSCPDAEALRVSVMLGAQTGLHPAGLHAVYVQKQRASPVWHIGASYGTVTDKADDLAKLVAPGEPVMFMFAAYVQQPRPTTPWRMARCEIKAGPPPPQQITADHVAELLPETGLGSRKLTLEELAGAIEAVRRRAVVAMAVECTLTKWRTDHHRRAEAIATLRRHLKWMIERRLGEGEDNASRFMRDARARLASLDQFPGTEPPPRLELAWHHAAVGLADCFLRASGSDAARWYRAGPAIRFVQRTLDMMGLGRHQPGAIERVIRERTRVG